MRTILQRVTKQSATQLAAYISTLFIVLFWYQHVSNYKADYWMVRAFDADESGVLADLMQMWRQGSFQPLNYIYGPLQHYLALILLYLISLFGIDTTVPVMMAVLRGINMAAGAGVLLIMCRITLVNGVGLIPGLVTIALLAFSPAFSSMAVNAKPELLQLFFITLSIYLLSKGGTWNFLWAGAAAGAAFSAKFGGVLLLPLAFISIILECNSEPVGRCLTKIIRLSLVFAIGIAISLLLLFPTIIHDLNVIAARLQFQTVVNSKGFLFFASISPTAWFKLLVSNEVFGLWGVPLLLIGIVTVFIATVNKKRKVSRIYIFSAVWAAGYIAYLASSVSVIASRYLLLSLPSLCILSGWGVAVISGYLTNRRLFMFRALVAASLLPGALATIDALSLLDTRDKSPRIQAGRKFIDMIPHDEVIASDLYTYVPPIFKNHVHRSYLDVQTVLTDRPKWIVSSREISDRFMDSSRENSFTDGSAAWRSYHEVYRGLRDGSILGLVSYKLEADFGEVRLYRQVIDK